MRWLDDILRIEKHSGDVRLRNQIFSLSGMIYEPAKGWVDDIWRVAANARPYVQAQGEAEGLRKSILDEKLPYRLDLVKKNLFGGGRIVRAMLLGMIKYHESCPELLEAATHDLNYEMRAESVQSLGEMGKQASKYTTEICMIVLKENDPFVRSQAVEACRNIGDKRAVPTIRNLLDDIKPLIRELQWQGYPFSGKDDKKRYEMEWTSLLLQHSLETLFHLDKKVGAEALAEALRDSSGVIRHHAKNALFSSDYTWADAFVRKTVPIYFPSQEEKQRQFLKALGLKE